MVKAILRDGRIQPVDPLPPDWVEGQELIIELLDSAVEPAQIERWTQEMDAASAGVPVDEHERFCRALEAIEQESKESVRREWGLG